jgi:hypothetical protein
MRSETQPSGSDTRYFVNAPFDFAFVGGISIASFLALKLFGPTGYSDSAASLAIVLMWIVNWPHFSATLYRLFRSKDNALQYPLVAALVPLIVYGGAVGAMFSPTLIAPYFVKLFMLWSPYHFSGQSVGISLIYARRHGVRLDGWPRRALSIFIFGTYVASTLASETGPGASYYGIGYPGLGVAPWMGRAALIVMYVAAAALLGFAARTSWKERRIFPPMVLLPALTQYVWFVAGANTPAFYILVPFFHSLQYLPIAWAMELGEAAGSRPGLTRRRLGLHSLRWAAINLAGGMVIFWALPHMAAAFGVKLTFATGVLVAAGQIHHFFVDGVIWKLRNPRVASPLVVNVRHFLAPPEGVPARAAA